jgi:hypothetical protein
MMLFIWAQHTSFFLGRPTRAPRLSLLPPSPTASRGPPVGQCRHPALWPRPIGQPLPSLSVRPAACTPRTLPAPFGLRPLPTGRRPPIGRDPLLVPPLPPLVGRAPQLPPHPTPYLTHLRPKWGRTTLPRLGPLFPPPSSLRAPYGQTPHHLPIRPTLGAPPPPNSGRIAVAVHPLGELLAAPVFHRSQPPSSLFLPMVQS